jgi:hypothetical protein
MAVKPRAFSGSICMPWVVNMHAPGQCASGPCAGRPSAAVDGSATAPPGGDRRPDRAADFIDPDRAAAEPGAKTATRRSRRLNANSGSGEKAAISIVTRALRTVSLIGACATLPGRRCRRRAPFAKPRRLARAFLCCELQIGMILPVCNSQPLKSTNRR